MIVLRNKWKYIISVFLVCILSSHTVVSQREVGDSCIYNRQAGICRSIYQCPYASRQWERFQIRVQTCGFQGNTPIVCCLEEGTQENTTPRVINNRPTTPRRTNGKRISERKCDEYSSQVTETIMALPLPADGTPVAFQTQKCEFSSTELIVGGHDAKLGEFPHMAAIAWITTDNEYSWKCGGALISEYYVLTAAHCAYSGGTDLISSEPSIIRLGEQNLRTTNDGASPYDVRIANMLLHPQYRSPSKYHDIALFRLQTSVAGRLSKFIRPACLWTRPNVEDGSATVIGWGNTRSNGETSDVLQAVTLGIVNAPTCSRYWQRRRSSLENGLVEQQLCAGNLTGGYDACQGDSGGPLQVYSKSNRCIHYLIGVTSFGNGCGLSNTVGVYTRVSSYVQWIEENVWPNQ